MTHEELQKFCSTDTDRVALMNPFNQDGFCCATNGHLIIRLHGTRPEYDEFTGPMLYSLFTEESLAQTLAPINMKLPPQEFDECHWCEGTGKEEVQTTTKSARLRKINCEDCGGTGKVLIESAPIDFGKRRLRVEYLRWIIALPNVRLAMDGGEYKAAYFTFDGGDGLLMPIRK